jgi:membrane-associated phospholipid phosphatase
MKFLTDFGDSAVLLPMSAVMLIWLLAMRPVAMALWWGGALLFLGGVMGGLKALFFACPPTADIISPSGHTGFSLLVYGGLAVIIAADRRALWLKALIILTALAFAVAIAVSRVKLEMHSTPETVIGFTVGAVSLGIFSLSYLHAGAKRHRIVPLLIGVAATLFLFYGSRLNAEDNLHALTGLLDLHELFCPR